MKIFRNSFPPYWIHHFEFRKSSVYKFSWRLNNFQNFGSPYWNHFEFSKSDYGFVISIPENPYRDFIYIYMDFHKNRKLLEIPIRHFKFRKSDSVFEIRARKTQCTIYNLSWKLNNFQNFGPPYLNRHFEF